MKIYVAHSTDFDFKKELYEPLKKAFSEKHELVFPHEKSSRLFDSKKMLKECGLVIAECSYPKIGVGIELGWADWCGIPILAGYKKNCKQSQSVNGIAQNIIEYGNDQGLVSEIKKIIQKM